MYVLYSILAMVAVLGLMPMFLYRLMVEPGFAQRLRESFGWWSDEEVAKVAGKGTDAIRHPVCPCFRLPLSQGHLNIRETWRARKTVRCRKI